MTYFAGECGQGNQFRAKRVLEFGPGPVLGFVPLLIVEGAAHAAVADPDYQELRNQVAFQNDYLFPIYETHRRPHRNTAPATFEAFLARVQAVDVHGCRAHEFPSGGEPFDVVISKSTLEYTHDMDALVECSHRVSAASSLHMHYIDFSLHRWADRQSTPFGTLYSQSRAANPEYFKNPGGELNLLRPSEVA